MNGNELAAQFIRDTRWTSLPDAVQHKVKMCLVGIIGAIVGGVLTPISDISADYAQVAWQGDDATILLHDTRPRAAEAVFANACADNALEQMVAVGMRVTPHPPHRSVHEELPHTAPASGNNAKAH